MKKTILSLTAIIGLTGLVQATTINAPSSLVGSQALDGNNAYSWGISIPLASGQVVATAEIDFTSLTLNSVLQGRTTGTLWTDLLKSSATGVNGVTTASDGDAIGDYWGTQFSGANIVNLGSKTLNLGATASWSYILTSSQINSLNSFLSANSGVFNIGIDPDCHWSVGGISFIYTTTTRTVPDATTTAFLLLLGLAALEVCRRHIASASKA
jgi:hypothetical protein